MCCLLYTSYYEERGQRKRYCEINRIVQGCTGIRRTTGQHPGGIIVLPIGWDIEEFTPVQHPANDMNSDIITTHFDYHSIDSNLQMCIRDSRYDKRPASEKCGNLKAGNR